MMEVNSIEEFVAGGESQLKVLADAGNGVAAEWLALLQVLPFMQKKLSLFGDMKIALLADARPEAIAVREEMFPEQGQVRKK